MKKFLYLVCILIFTISISVADDSERTCSSNVYLVKDRIYVKNLDFKNRSKFSELPDWVPVIPKKIYQNAQSLPINATQNEILKISDAEPKIQKMGKIHQKYTWDFKDDVYQYQLSVYRPFGCISELSMGMHELKSADKTIHFFIQYLLVPSGKTTLKISKDEDACKKHRVKKQQYLYLKNGKVPPNNSRDVPTYANMVFQLIDSFYNHSRNKVTAKIGLPFVHGDSGALKWRLKDKQGTVFEVTLNAVENCDKILKIEWIDKAGVSCSLSKENFY